MALITWDDRLAVNVPELDRQHQKLVALINDLDTAMQQGKSRDAVCRILDGFVSYTEFHFGAEEKILEQHGYPGTVTHRDEHAAFVKTISDFKTGHARGRMGVSVGVMTFLSDWLRRHIMDTDRAYADHLIANGVR